MCKGLRFLTELLFYAEVYWLFAGTFWPIGEQSCWIRDRSAYARLGLVVQDPLQTHSAIARDHYRTSKEETQVLAQPTTQMDKERKRWYAVNLLFFIIWLKFGQDSNSYLYIFVDAQSIPTVWKLGDFLFLKLVGNLFPVTDFQHAITTSATILMAQVINLLWSHTLDTSINFLLRNW